MYVILLRVTGDDDFQTVVGPYNSAAAAQAAITALNHDPIVGPRLARYAGEYDLFADVVPLDHADALPVVADVLTKDFDVD